MTDGERLEEIVETAVARWDAPGGWSRRWAGAARGTWPLRSNQTELVERRS